MNTNRANEFNSKVNFLSLFNTTNTKVFDRFNNLVNYNNNESFNNSNSFNSN